MTLQVSPKRMESFKLSSRSMVSQARLEVSDHGASLATPRLDHGASRPTRYPTDSASNVGYRDYLRDI